MKRYEKMTKEEIIEAFVTNVTTKVCKRDECKDPNITCAECCKNWLNEEIEMKPRWATYNGDFEKAFEDWKKQTECTDGCFAESFRPCGKCYNDWLKEEVEV